MKYLFLAVIFAGSLHGMEQEADSVSYENDKTEEAWSDFTELENSQGLSDESEPAKLISPYWGIESLSPQTSLEIYVAFVQKRMLFAVDSPSIVQDCPTYECKIEEHLTSKQIDEAKTIHDKLTELFKRPGVRDLNVSEVVSLAELIDPLCNLENQPLEQLQNLMVAIKKDKSFFSDDGKDFFQRWIFYRDLYPDEFQLNTRGALLGCEIKKTKEYNLALEDSCVFWIKHWVEELLEKKRPKIAVSQLFAWINSWGTGKNELK